MSYYSLFAHPWITMYMCFSTTKQNICFTALNPIKVFSERTIGLLLVTIPVLYAALLGL
jgi:hypothetical protein